MSVKLDFCGRLFFDRHQRNFTSQIELSNAGSDFEKELANKAQRLPLRHQSERLASNAMGHLQPCANLATMKFFSLIRGRE